MTFSTDTGILTIKDNIQTGKLAEQYFKMETSPDQIPATLRNVKWTNKNIPDCANAIKDNNKIVGFTFIIPSTKRLMEDFISKRITENQMFEQIKKKVNYGNFEAIYLCSAFIKPEYRKKGMAFEAFIKSIKKITCKRKVKPILFYWKFTEEGEGLSKKIAKKLGLKIKMRE